MDPFRSKYRDLSSEEKAKLALLKEKYSELYQMMDEMGGSREMSLAKTKLEESCMWAVKHLTA